MVKGEGENILRRVETYAAGGKASRPWWRRQCGPDGRRARTSSGPRRSRRSERSRWTCRHRTGCGNRRRRPGPCWTCTGRPASRGAHPWRRWGGWGGGRPWKRRKEYVSRAVPRAILCVSTVGYPIRRRKDSGAFCLCITFSSSLEKSRRCTA